MSPDSGSETSTRQPSVPLRPDSLGLDPPNQPPLTASSPAGQRAVSLWNDPAPAGLLTTCRRYAGPGVPAGPVDPAGPRAPAAPAGPRCAQSTDAPWFCAHDVSLAATWRSGCPDCWQEWIWEASPPWAPTRPAPSSEPASAAQPTSSSHPPLIGRLPAVARTRRRRGGGSRC